MRGACAGAPAIEYLDRNAARGQPPGNAQAHHARPDDGDALLSGLLSGLRFSGR
jgi:hypothetical protein